MHPGGGEGEHSPRGNGDGWINGLLTGAERFLNAVLGSETPSSSSSSSDSLSSDEKDGNGSLAISTTRNEDLIQKGKDPKSMECLDQDLAIVSEIDSKQAIEQLLMEETFSREECNNLVNLIQSRVIDSDEQPISWEKDGEMPPPKLGFSLFSPKFLSLGSSPYHSPDLEYTAVDEARKWLDAKKSPNCGPCVLNTSSLFEFDPETGSSPVEVARSYMNSLSQKNCDKVLKRRYESSVSGEPPERTKRLKLLLEGSLDIPKFKQLDVNSTVPSSYQAQASIGVNDTQILTAIPLDPSDLHVNKPYQIYGSTSKASHNTNQVDNAWVPYVTCAMEPTEIQLEGWVPPTEMCSPSKLILHEDIATVPNTSRRVKGGSRGCRSRGKSRAGSGVARKSPCGKANDNDTKGSEQKSSTPRPRRRRGAKLS